MRAINLCAAMSIWSGAAAAQDISPPRVIAFCRSSLHCPCRRHGCWLRLKGGSYGFGQRASFVNFTAKDLPVVGFVGTRVAHYDARNPVLWVDHVYINTTQNDADGQCSYATEDEDKTFSRVECKPLLHDGRKVSAVLDGKAEPFSPAPGAETATSSDAPSCEKTIRVHGLLTRAQFQCGYRQ